MSEITLNGDAARQLSEIRDRVEIRDAHGRLLGIFEPGISDADLGTFERLRELGFTGTLSEFIEGKREVRRAIEDPEYARDWKTTDEIMAKLKSLP